MGDVVRRCLIVDTETTSLDPETGQVIEIGAILYSLVSLTSLASYSALIPAETNPAAKINGIPDLALAEVATIHLDMKVTLATMRSHADVIVCHNVEFDQQWFRGDWLTLPWICTMSDFDWPAASREAGSLINLALEHGIGVASAHRALTDCQLIAALFDRMPMFGRDLGVMFAHAMRPKGIFQAIVPFEEKDRAKEAGFKWDGGTKRWTRRMAIEDAAAWPFKTLLLKETP